MLKGAAMMDRLLSKRQKLMISSRWIASAPLILMSTQHEYQSVSLPTCYHRDSHHTSVWQEAVEDGRGSPCRHSLWQSVHCNVEQVSANLTQRHQSTAPVSDADDYKDRSVGRLILWMWSHSATCKYPPTQLWLEGSLHLWQLWNQTPAFVCFFSSR